MLRCLFLLYPCWSIEFLVWLCVNVHVCVGGRDAERESRLTQQSKSRKCYMLVSEQWRFMFINPYRSIQLKVTRRKTPRIWELTFNYNFSLSVTLCHPRRHPTKTFKLLDLRIVWFALPVVNRAELYL